MINSDSDINMAIKHEKSIHWKRRNKQHLHKPPGAPTFLQLKSIFLFLNGLITKIDF